MSAFIDLLHEHLAAPERMSSVEAQQRLQQAAFSEQMAATGQSYDEATDSVYSMLFQLLRLNSEGFPAPSWQAAIMETVAYGHGNLAVRSLPAQRAWKDCEAAWQALVEVTPSPGEMPRDMPCFKAALDRDREAGQAWRAAWDDWIERHKE